jgi:hypothetical protein
MFDVAASYLLMPFPIKDIPIENIGRIGTGAGRGTRPSGGRESREKNAQRPNSETTHLSSPWN